MKLLELFEKILNFVVLAFVICFFFLIATAPFFLYFFGEGVRAFIEGVQNACGERIFQNILALFFGLASVKSIFDIRHYRTYEDRPLAVSLFVFAVVGIAFCIHFILI